jgi:3-hydroxyacyl-[acyl-carrier-protein] dehydratase
MNDIMTIQDIMKSLPHRFPFLLIDRVISLEEGKSIVALKNVTMNEPFFTGHFPERPIMPGVLILEAMAQAAGVLAYKSVPARPDSKTLYLFAGIDNARFKRMVEPGDQLIIEVEFDRAKSGIWKFKGTAKVNNAIVCTADLMSAGKEIQS